MLLPNYLKRVWLALFGLTLLRLLVCSWLPLSPDEAYYRIWALAPSAGYLDHPPMVAMFIAIGQFLAGDTPLGVRFMGPVGAAVGTVLLLYAARDWARLRGLTEQQAAQVGVKAAFLLNGTLALGAGSLLMTPDTPLLCFMVVMLWGLARLLLTGHGAWWLVLGCAAGLGFESKYTAALPVAGLVAWLFFTSGGRYWLKTKWPWLGGLCAVLCMVPVLYWNATHHWVSFFKQGGRVGDWHPARMFTFFGELFGGQLGLATPGIFVFFACGAVLLIKQRDTLSRALLFMVVLSGLVFVQHAVGARVQANWPVVIYPMLALAGTLPAWGWWRSAGGFGFALTGLIFLQALFAPVKASPHFDVTLRQMGGWADFVQSTAQSLPAGAPLIADDYGLASELAFYAPTERAVIAAEPRWALFALKKAPCTEGYLIRGHKQDGRPEDAGFTVLAQMPERTRARYGSVADTYKIYKVRLACTAAGQAQSAVLLPHKAR